MRQKIYYLLSGLIGLLIGWLALGWWLWPVAYVGDAYPYELNQADRLRYAQGAVDGFTLTGQVDPDWFSGWTGDEIKNELEQVVQQPIRANSARAMAEKMGLLLGWRVNINPTPVPLTAKLAKAQADQADGAGLPDWLPYLALAIVVTMLVGGGLTVAHSVTQAKARLEVKRSQSHDFDQYFIEQQESRFTPLRQVSTSLAQAQLEFGPGLPIDQHFPIEGGGVHLGEFGVNQVDDQPAWDVWLFDQKAIVTVTKVLADRKSEELASRGEVIGWDGPFLLETSNLKMTGKASMVEAGLRVELTVEGKGE